MSSDSDTSRARWIGRVLTGRVFRAGPFLSSHPSDEELLAFLDGELDGRALTRIRSHLDACWPCRGRRDRFNHAIAAFVDARLDDCARREGFPPSAALKLSARLDEVDARAPKPSFWRRMLWHTRGALAWRPTPAAVAQGCVAALTIALVVLSIGRGPSVSAHELLARTVAAQEARLRPVPQPVVYQRLQVSRRAGGAGSPETRQTWEIWADTVHGRYRERIGAFAPIARRAAFEADACGAAAAPTRIHELTPARELTATREGTGRELTSREAAGREGTSREKTTGETTSGEGAPGHELTPIRELESILCANGLPPAQPLSARAYSEWRGRVRGASERVRENQASDDEPAALVLHTRLPGDDRPLPMRIREAELVVRADDWHPLAQRFTVEIDRQLITYELRELSFEVVELASVAPAFFDESPHTSPSPLTTTAGAGAAVEAVSEADVIAAEVQAWEALYRLGALRGEPVEIVRAQTSPRVEVRGLASSPERKQEIVDAVSAIPLVTASIRTVDEALAAKPTPKPKDSAATAAVGTVGTVVQTGTVPIQPLIDAYLQGRRESEARIAYAGAGAPVETAGNRQRNAADLPRRGAQALATDVVSLSREAMADAWALERLARFAQGLGASAVRPTARRTLERMASELAAGAAAKLDALSQRVTPIVEPLLESAPSPSPSSTSSTSSTPSTSSTSSTSEAAASGDIDANGDTSWPRLALRVFARAREADEITRRLFTESDAGLVELGPSARELIAACAYGRQDALTLNERLTSHIQ